MRVQHLFFSTDQNQQTLHRRITPTAEQREQQQVRWNDVRDYLIGDLGEKTGLSMSSWLQGSYKFGTQIRPTKSGEFDIDLGIYFGWAGVPGDGRLGPQEMKKHVQQSLAAYAVEAEDDVLEVVEPPKERCARIRFSGNFHIDVPSYHLDTNADARSLATETHGWEVSDPKAFYLWFRGMFADDDNALARRLIRYVKMWATLNLEHCPSSVLITVLVAQAYAGLSKDQSDSDDEALRYVATAVGERLAQDYAVPNPVRPVENLNRLSLEQTRNLIEALEGLVAVAGSALAAQTETEAALHWAGAFHHFFPAPREAGSQEVGKALVPIAFDPQILVEATPKGNAQVFRNTNRIGPIPKNCSILFTLQNANLLPPGARIQWIVRNEGEEAELTNDLGHLAGSGPQATESSAYRGTHYMDVMVSSAYGSVLGFRRIPVQISGVVMPPRNPKRPGWIKFRKRVRFI